MYQRAGTQAVPPPTHTPPRLWWCQMCPSHFDCSVRGVCQPHHCVFVAVWANIKDTSCRHHQLVYPKQQLVGMMLCCTAVWLHWPVVPSPCASSCVDGCQHRLVQAAAVVGAQHRCAARDTGHIVAATFAGSPEQHSRAQSHVFFPNGHQGATHNVLFIPG